MEMCHD
jgi:hypothetical protein